MRIGAGAYETQLAMCPVAAAVRYAEKSGDRSSNWNPAWGTKSDFRRRVVDFVAAFDACAESVGLSPTLDALRDALARRSLIVGVESHGWETCSGESEAVIDLGVITESP